MSIREPCSQQPVRQHAPRAPDGLGEGAAVPLRQPRHHGRRHRPRLRQPGLHDLDGIAEGLERLRERALVLLRRERAGGVDERAARLERHDGGEEQATLLRAHLLDLAAAPVTRRLGIVREEAALGGARRVQQHAVERLRLRLPDARAVADPRRHARRALRLYVRAELVEARAHLLHRHHLALVLHQRRQLAGLGAGRGTEIQDPLARLGREQVRRQLAAGVLDVERALGVRAAGEERGTVRRPVRTRDPRDGLERNTLGVQPREGIGGWGDERARAERGLSRRLERGEHARQPGRREDFAEAVEEEIGQGHGAKVPAPGRGSNPARGELGEARRESAPERPLIRRSAVTPRGRALTSPGDSPTP